MNAVAAANILNSIVPINRFNDDGANAVFSEVKTDGIRIVVKNNIPECVLISPKDYQKMLEDYEDLLLTIEAQKRLSDGKKPISHEDLMLRYNLTESDLDDVEDDLEL